jgi:hypothetical protein
MRLLHRESSLSVARIRSSQTHIITHRHLVSGYRFEASTAEGAILMLPEGASRTDLRSTGKFRNYAIKHGVSWYQFVNGTLQEEVRNGSLYLITGMDRAFSYGVASFSDPSGCPDTMSASFLTIGDDTSPIGRSYSWYTQDPIDRRTGRSKEGTKNQCVFIRGFKIALKESVFAGLFSGGVVLAEISRTGSSSAVKHSIPFAGGVLSPSANTYASSSTSSSSSSHSPPGLERRTDVLLGSLPGYSSRVLLLYFTCICRRIINLQIYTATVSSLGHDQQVSTFKGELHLFRANPLVTYRADDHREVKHSPR